MVTVKTWGDILPEKQLNRIIRLLEDGGIIIWPTDTLYALACDAFNQKAVEKICRIKGINPEKQNLSVVIKDISQASKYVRMDNSHFKMLRDNTPGPFTFIFKITSSMPKIFKGRKMMGIRIPDNRIALQIVERFDRPILTSSVEFDEDDYALNPELIAESYEDKADLIIDDGDGGTQPSTVIDCTEDVPEIIREGKGELR